ncbi:hypothetical protein PLEOSDRAFT_1046357 [Pleurotus ostreatus PC15]|uniref:Uncharacterized protein n=1 Tax=Pleurotus ostreatus (strain PC15) TaxID=1137138 RepID=A0A067NAK7_PLEO1|nr:hypothetical protein PLEOSDRAFT_1046357 [Pleurotus ostreatus PC15]
MVLASDSIFIAPGHCSNVPVILPDERREAWFIEGLLLSEDGQDVLAVPATLVTSTLPYLPIANPTTRPLCVHKGDIVGYAFDPQTYFDSPSSSDQLERLQTSAFSVQKLINACNDIYTSKGGSTPLSPSPPPSTSSELWGPKTTATPEEDSPTDVVHAVHLGPDIPEDVRPALEEVLQRRFKAFGVGGHLGRVDRKATIPLKPGVQPISLPMYGTSPAKREVLDAQLNKWFVQEVIEPSKSP